MFIHMSIHYPKEEFKNHLRESMYQFKSALENADRFLEGLILEDEITGRIIGMIKWKSRSNMKKNIHLAAAAIENDDFDKWKEKPPESFYLSAL